MIWVKRSENYMQLCVQLFAVVVGKNQSQTRHQLNLAFNFNWFPSEVAAKKLHQNESCIVYCGAKPNGVKKN